MKAPRAPRLDERRAPAFSAELQQRARAWIPAWGLADNQHDFGRALLEIAARFNSEVAERLDGAGEKMRRGFLDWLGERGQAARAARMPVVFKLADTAREGVLAPAPVRMQADAGGTPVVFETEKDVRIVPGRLEVVVGIDADQDAFFLPPPGLSELNPLEPLPTQWRVKSFAAANRNKIQLDPEGGLVPGSIVEAAGQQYRIVAADKDLVTIEPPLTQALPTGTTVVKVERFSPFESRSRNQQQHALYLGDSELLNIEANATIEVIGASALREGYVWEFWGKLGDDDEEKWWALDINKQQPTVGSAVVLIKPDGKITEHEIDGKKSRWIRAYRKTVDAAGSPITSDEFSIRLNAEGCTTKPPCPPIDSTAQSPLAEGMANTTPVVLNNLFFPLGKEPRQFDAFYLGSDEAFSKLNAKVQLCFEMADSTFAVLSSLRTGSYANQTLAGVAADGHLHLLFFDSSGRLMPYGNRAPLRPPSPGPSGAIVVDPPITLDRRPAFRPAMWSIGTESVVAVTAQSAVWAWRENTFNPAQSGWQSLGDVGPVGGSAILIEGLVYLADGGAGQLFALRDSTLFVRDLNTANAQWLEVKTEDNNGDPVVLKRIAPIGVEGADLGSGLLSEGLVGVAEDEALYAVTFSGNPLAGDCTQLLFDVATNLAPAAIRRSSDNKLVAMAVGKNEPGRLILAFLSQPGTFAFDDFDSEELEWPDVLGESIDVNLSAGQLTFALCAQVDAQSTGLTTWVPFDSSPSSTLFNTKIPAQIGLAFGAPTLLPQHVMVPTASGKVIVASFDPALRSTFIAPLGSVVITVNAADKLSAGDSFGLVVDNAGAATLLLESIPDAGVQYRGRTFHAFPTPTIDDQLFVYKAASDVFVGTIPETTKLDEMLIDPLDDTTVSGSVLLITTDTSTKLYEVLAFDLTTSVATLDQDLEVANDSLPVDYQVPDPSGATVRPLLQLDAVSGNWDAALLDSISLRFEAPADPELQEGTAFQVNANRPELVALSDSWVTAPVDPGLGVQFLVDGAVGAWTAQLGDTSSNPELSWEYWNGTGWGKLNPVLDETLNFKRTGVVSFTVPTDLRSGDWAGKTNHWIRARLIGGDYGREEIKVRIKDLGGGESEQIVDRSTKGIRPPSVLRLHISYAICDEVLPTFVLAEDSGTMRDQSDANRTQGAIVEAFVPLALTLGRLTKKTASPEPPKPTESCPPDCDCQTLHPSKTTRSSAATADDETDTIRVTGRELYIGLAATPSEAPVNVLMLVDEHPHSAFAPMRVEALVAERFAPIVADDTTRALGESGVLSLAFPLPPTRGELFGKKDLSWLRLVPKNANNDWVPTLRGAYLNAAWASATETLTRELLGSSDGAPNLTVRVARPPVLYDTLELRVKEPLGEEERNALLKQDPTSVLSAVEGLPGDWVLWKQVIDPDDEGATARVYNLDEASGEIHFGDGRHGKIPPIGRDSIVAFSYARTEPDPTGGDSVPGNTITARTALNLVSPVETVESVTAADPAAGGAPPESDERVLRFGFARLRHRSRAVTAEDLQDLALQSSPDIVQARAFQRKGFVRLVVVMRGMNPTPNAAQIRELRRYLLDAAPPALSVPAALRIEGPRIRRLRIDLELLVEKLDHAGELSAFVKHKLAQFFETATGGVDEDGWQLGANPSEEEIALAISEAPYLESIERISLFEINEDGKEFPSMKAPGSREIVMLADDPVRIQFETAEVMV